MKCRDRASIIFLTLLLTACGGGGSAPAPLPATDTYTVSISVAGLAGSGLVLQNNGGDDMSVSSDGDFSFATKLEDGTDYAVTVHSQPANPNQTCTVLNANGTIVSANVIDVDVTCVTDTYTVSTNAGTGGSIDPINVSVAYGNTTAFTIQPDSGYIIDAASGCSGNLSGATYITGVITADCTVNVHFRLPMPSFSIDAATATEGNAPDVTDLEFTVSLSAAVSGDVSVDYSTADGSATAGIDYQTTTGTLTLPAGSTSAVIRVPVLGDADDESNETLTVSLSNPSSNASIAIGSATGTILDDDGATGGGTGTGFSFIKLDDAGEALADQGSDYASLKWACVQDKDTGLTWEVKTDDDSLRDKDWTYSWYRKPNGVDLGNSGQPSGGTCVDTDHCDTDQFVAAVNATGLCGRTDWRLPTRSELLSIVHYGAAAAPFISGNYFPNTSTDRSYWTTDEGQSWSARTVDFMTGKSTTEIFFSELGIRLVSGGER